MTLRQAKMKLRKLINFKFSHAVLLYNKEEGYYTELHPGHAGNCCCNHSSNFVWREEAPYTKPLEVWQIGPIAGG